MEIALNLLRPGRELGIDVRSHTNVEIAELANDIDAVGLLQPLGVFHATVTGTDAGLTAFVVYGNRRLAALNLMAERRQLPADWPVPVQLFEGTRIQALEASLVENTSRAALHPVDAYEAMVSLVAGGLSEKAIAKRRSMTPKQVKQVLALGKLAPEVRAAWRAGDLDAETAQAFTLEPDLAKQVALLESGQVGSPWEVRRALAGQGYEIEKLIAFVGRDAYVEAGGAIVPDLFTDQGDVISDVALLQRLSDAKLEALATAEKREHGWAAVYMPDFDYNLWSKMVQHGVPALLDEEVAELEQIESRWEKDQRRRELETAARVRSLTAEQRAGLACRINVHRDGTVTYDRGYGARLPAADKLDTGPGNTTKAPAEGFAEPRYVVDDLRIQLTKGLATALSRQPGPAITVLIATLLGYGDSPAIIRSSGASDDSRETPLDLADKPFVERVAVVDDMFPDDREELLGRLVSLSLDARTTARGSQTAMSRGVTDAGIEAVAGLLDGEALNASLAAVFDAAGYFAGVNRATTLEAISEAIGPAGLKAVAKLKKTELAAWAVANVTPTGWLPTILRLGAYKVTPPAVAEPEPPPKSPARRALETQAAADKAGKTPAASEPPSRKWNGAQKEHFAKLAAGNATSRDTAMSNSAGLSAGTMGSLVRYGQAAKATVKGEAGQSTVYWLTEAGAATAAAPAAPKSRTKKGGKA